MADFSPINLVHPKLDEWLISLDSGSELWIPGATHIGSPARCVSATASLAASQCRGAPNVVFGETIVEASKNGGWTVENGGKIQENGANTREDHWEHGDWEVFDAS